MARCKWCNYSGKVVAITKYQSDRYGGAGITYVFRCGCVMGATCTLPTDTWTISHESSFEADYMRDEKLAKLSPAVVTNFVTLNNMPSD